MRFLLPLILALIGLGAGLGAGMFLYVPPDEPAIADADHGDGGADHSDPYMSADSNGEDAALDDATDPAGLAYVKLNNQFVVPLVSGGRVAGLVVMSLSLEVKTGNEETIYTREPKLRDAFLRVLFDHANAGGFSGDFTRSTNMMVLRDSLLEIARKNLGDIVTNVMITDLVRQDT